VDFTYPGDVHLSFSSTQLGTMAASMPVEAVWFERHGGHSLLGPMQITAHSLGVAGCGQFRYRRGSSPPTEPSRTTWLLPTGQGTDLHRKHHLRAVAQPDCRRGGDRAQLHVGPDGRYQRREVTWEDLLAQGETYQLGMSISQFA